MLYHEVKLARLERSNNWLKALLYWSSSVKFLAKFFPICSYRNLKQGVCLENPKMTRKDSFAQVGFS
jgi:hypothetical protein